MQHRWSVNDFNEVYEAHLNNVVDVDGSMKAGATIGWLLNPHRSADTPAFKSNDWALFMPTPPQAEQADPNTIRDAMAQRYG